MPRILVLIAILLLPVQMRAGASDPHPHALLQLLLDASDGKIDHHDEPHRDGAHAAHEREPAAPRAHDPDVPTFEEPAPAASGTAMLTTLVVLLTVPLPGLRQVWPLPAARTGRVPALEPPPPRG